MKTFMQLLSGCRWPGVILGLCLGLTSWSAQAKYACSAPTVSVSSASYDPFLTATVLSGQVSLSCSKTTGDAASMAFSLSVDLGLYASGGYSYASLNTGLIRYDLLRSTTSSDLWSSTPIDGTMTNWTSNNGSASVNFYMLIPAAQSVAYTPSGSNYADTRVVTLLYPDQKGVLNVSATGSLSVSIAVPAKCVLSSPPGNINFTYTSFQASTARSSTAFSVQCVNNTQYTMALDASSGTLLGLNYTVSMNKTGTQTGTFTAQSVTITGSMASGQSGSWTAGKCTTSSCTDQHTRVLTISY